MRGWKVGGCLHVFDFWVIKKAPLPPKISSSSRLLVLLIPLLEVSFPLLKCSCPVERCYPFILINLLQLNRRVFVSFFCIAGLRKAHGGKGDPGRRSTGHAKGKFCQGWQFGWIDLWLRKIHYYPFAGICWTGHDFFCCKFLRLQNCFYMFCVFLKGQ